MTDKTKTKEIEKVEALEVKSVPAAGFRRCGRFFGCDCSVIPMSELTPEQVETLEAEANLIVKRIQLDAATTEQ